MTRHAPSLLLVSALVGYAAGSVSPRADVAAQGGRGGQPADPLGTPAPNIPPVANPPLYPDPPLKPMHWSIDDLRKVHEARAALDRKSTRLNSSH